jgi:hypothetical protein
MEGVSASPAPDAASFVDDRKHLPFEQFAFLSHGRIFLRGLSVGVAMDDPKTGGGACVRDQNRVIALRVSPAGQLDPPGACDREVQLVHCALKCIQGGRAPVRLAISRSKLVAEMAHFWQTACDEDLLAPLDVAFAGERAIDGGTQRGPSTELLTTYISEVAADWSAGERKHGPAADRGLGYVVGKLLLMGKSADLAVLSSSKWTLLLGGEPLSASHTALEALSHYDALAASRLEATLTDESAWCAFEDDGGNPLTAASVTGFVATAAASLCAAVEKPLLSAREGFVNFCDQLPEALREALTPEMVLSLLQPESVSATSLVARLEFRNWPAHNSTPYFLCCWIHAADADQRSKFLRMVTGATTLPGMSRERIVIVRSPDQFLARTCFWQLCLPDFHSTGELSDALEAALATADGVFHEM